MEKNIKNSARSCKEKKSLPSLSFFFIFYIYIYIINIKVYDKTKNILNRESA